MLRIALTSIITLAAAYAVHNTAETTALIHILMLIGSGFLAGSLVMFAILSDSDSEGAK